MVFYHTKKFICQKKLHIPKFSLFKITFKILSYLDSIVIDGIVGKFIPSLFCDIENSCLISSGIQLEHPTSQIRECHVK